MTNTAIVLDGNQRAALAVVRSLGQHGLRVVVCSTNPKPLAGASRWCASTHVIPDVAFGIDALASELARIVRHEQATVIFPITDASMTALLGHSMIGTAKIACPPEQAYAGVSNKATLVSRAIELGVPTPASTIVRSAEEFGAALVHWSGKVVIKPALSRYRANGQVRSTAVIVANDRDEALALLPQFDWLEFVPCILQEFIPGHGAGIFTVYGSNGPVAWFSHRRLREKPPSGGVSVLSESAPLNTEMQALAKSLLDDAGWLGPAMVEFRVDTDGKPWLMEINGRFWGSLQLSIDSGLDMPWLWYQIASGKSPAAIEAYDNGIRLRWLLGDLDNLYLTLRHRDFSARRKLRAVFSFLNFFNRNTRLEVLRLRDIRPFFRELKNWIRNE